MNYIIRNAKIEDADEILNIYSYYVLNTAITFDVIVPTVDEFKNRIKEFSKRYPYIVIEENNKVVGYAYAVLFHNREAYKYSVELSIYLDKNYTKMGLGKLLYNEMENRLKNMGVKNLYSCITKPDIPDQYVDNNSEKFHERMGFNLVGTFHKCGYKFDKWYNVIWMEKMI